MTFTQDWKEKWVDRMGLIVALSGQHRFDVLNQFKADMGKLSAGQQIELKDCLRRRFTPTNGQDGCKEATASVRDALNDDSH